MEKRPARKLTDEIKRQMVQLHVNGKPAKEIIKEYDLTPSALHKWVRQYNSSGSFKEKDNQTPQKRELIKLRKITQQLLMENDSVSYRLW